MGKPTAPADGGLLSPSPTSPSLHILLSLPDLLLALPSSFGAITRIKSFVPDRTTLAAVSAAGPLWGAAASLPIMLVGAVLSAQGVGGVELDVNSFRWGPVSALQAEMGRLVMSGTAWPCIETECSSVVVCN